MALRVPQGGGFFDKGMTMGQSGLQAYASQRPGMRQETKPPDPTIGGALMSGAGMGLAGAALGASELGAAMGLTGGVGAAIGIGLGVIGHLLS